MCAQLLRPFPAQQPQAGTRRGHDGASGFSGGCPIGSTAHPPGLIQRKVQGHPLAHNGGMEHIEQLKALGLFDARVPRYTSYPTAAVFAPDIGAAFQQDQIQKLDPK